MDRASAICRFCDTEFVGVDGEGGGKFDSAEALSDAIEDKWPHNSAPGKRFVVCTGGEPLLQLDSRLIAALHTNCFEIAVESNGTIAAPPGLDWLCVSPKAGAELAQRSGDELKLVYPQPGADPANFELLSFRHFFLQPMDGPHRAANTELALRYCFDHPQWRLSLQTHKLLGIP
jgi:7-carboxy-7-deazaguanine synthase (Cx14CxxC type)